jgi:hypothetical protein
MFFHIIAFATTLLLLHALVSAEDLSECASVLRPNEEQSKSDYTAMQAYMSLHASYEYERLRKLDNTTRGADATYKLFSAQYNDSTSREDFQKNVSQRLDDENFALDQAEARAYSRKYVSDTQVKAWLGCVVANSRGGSLLLVASNPGKPHFALVAAWAPQRGVGTGDLIVTAAGASFDAPNGPKRITRELRGPSDTSMIIYPDEQAERIDITADIAGATAEPFHVKLERPEKTGTIPLVLYNNFLPDRGGMLVTPQKTALTLSSHHSPLRIFDA